MDTLLKKCMRSDLREMTLVIRFRFKVWSLFPYFIFWRSCVLYNIYMTIIAIWIFIELVVCIWQHFIEVSVPSQVHERHVRVCLRVSNLHVSTIFSLDVRTVLMGWYFFFILLHEICMRHPKMFYNQQWSEKLNI
jgi:hypothetical protein